MDNVITTLSTNLSYMRKVDGEESYELFGWIHTTLRYRKGYLQMNDEFIRILLCEL